MNRTITSHFAPALLMLAFVCACASAAQAEASMPARIASCGGVEASGAGIVLRGSVGGLPFGSCQGSSVSVLAGFWFPGLFVPASAPEAIETTAFPFSLHTLGAHPAHGSMTLAFSVPGRNTAAVPVRLEVFDVAGRLVSALVRAELPPGRYRARWPEAESADRLAASVFFCRLVAGKEMITRRLVLIK